MSGSKRALGNRPAISPKEDEVTTPVSKLFIHAHILSISHKTKQGHITKSKVVYSNCLSDEVAILTCTVACTTKEYSINISFRSK